MNVRGAVNREMFGKAIIIAPAVRQEALRGNRLYGFDVEPPGDTDPPMTAGSTAQG